MLKYNTDYAAHEGLRIFALEQANKLIRLSKDVDSQDKKQLL